MASLEMINFTRMSSTVAEGRVHWSRVDQAAIRGLPQIFWSDNTPWREANLWATQRAADKSTNVKTILSAMKHIHAYAIWLERESIDWWHFPIREADRCLLKFRGHLIHQRDNGQISPSTSSQRINAVIRFYRWLKKENLISSQNPMWNDRKIGIHIEDSMGFVRTIEKEATDLSIRNTKKIGRALEDGLLPVSSEAATQILNFADTNASVELALMLKLGFTTGMRIGTICDLKELTIEHSVPNPWIPDWHLLAVGPGAHPSVHTKLGVTGQVWISNSVLQILREYMFSTRRLKRQALAKPEHRDVIFLNRFGKPYASEGVDSSQAINVEMTRLRKAGLTHGIKSLRDFHFHRTRCTFGTELARVTLKHGGAKTAISLVMLALLHRDERTTLRYIKFVEQQAAASELGNEYTRNFLSLDFRPTK